jgi:hypothetical protein
MNFEQPNQIPQMVDLSNDFINSPFDDFQDVLRKNRNSPISIFVNLCNLSNEQFVSLVRRLKSIADNPVNGQERKVKVKGTKEQKLLDINAFQSGVIFEEVS